MLFCKNLFCHVSSRSMRDCIVYMQEIDVVTPCGACRELLIDHAPDCMVILPGGIKRAVRELLPLPYRR